MFQNLLTEFIGIFATALLVDAVYAYRLQKKDAEYLRCVVESIKSVSANAGSLAFGFFGGRFLRLTRLDTPREANVLASLIDRLQKYNRDMDAIIDRHSILTNPAFILRLNFIIADVDRVLRRLEVIHDWQVNRGALRNDERVLHRVSGHDYENLMEAAEFLGVNDSTSLRHQYQSLSDAYAELDNFVAELTQRRVRFGSVLLHDSLLAELGRWAGALMRFPKATPSFSHRYRRRFVYRKRGRHQPEQVKPSAIQQAADTPDNARKMFMASGGIEHLLTVWQARQQYADVIHRIALTVDDPDDDTSRVLFDVTNALSHLRPLVGSDKCDLWRKLVGAPFVDNLYTAKADPSKRRRLFESFQRDWPRTLAEIEAMLPIAELPSAERRRQFGNRQGGAGDARNQRSN